MILSNDAVKWHLDRKIDKRMQRRIARRKRVDGGEIHLAIESLCGRSGGILIRRHDADDVSLQTRR